MKDNSEPLVVMIRESGLPENSDDVRDIYKKAEKKKSVFGANSRSSSRRVSLLDGNCKSDK